MSSQHARGCPGAEALVRTDTDAGGPVPVSGVHPTQAAQVPAGNKPTRSAVLLECLVKFRATPLAGAFIVGIEPQADIRGYFARTWCSREFAAQGLPAQLVQTSISRNLRRGTVRGMHLQLPPSREAKLVSCLHGAIHDVIIDMRPQSSTYLRHFATALTAETH